MSELERLRLPSKRREASSLLAVTSATVLATLDAGGAWWMCHDEGDLDAMVSLALKAGDEWTVRPVKLIAPGKRRTDAEALARIGDTVFVFGSSFVDKSGDLDDRRAFIARFSEAAAAEGAVDADVLDLGSTLVDLVVAALADVDLLRSADASELINVEGAGFVGSDLVIGLRWPVASDGQPLLVRLTGAGAVLSSPDWSVGRLAALPATVVVVDVGASAKRPAGVRGLTVVAQAIHLVIGQTERDLADKKVKAATARHVRLETLGSVQRIESIEVETFEGFRKVEGVAPTPGGGWLYALDDEDAIVLLASAADFYG